jgi:hypothetical protein
LAEPPSEDVDIEFRAAGFSDRLGVQQFKPYAFTSVYEAGVERGSAPGAGTPLFKAYHAARRLSPTSGIS